MDLAGGTPLVRAKAQTKDGPQAVGVFRGTDQTDPQAGFACGVVKKAGGGPILGDDQVRTPIGVKIRDGASPLLPADLDSAPFPS